MSLEPGLHPDNQGRGLLRRWFRRAAGASATPTHEGIVVAFASGKGGTGKSFLSTSAALVLHSLQQRAVLVDCDFGLANAHLLFGVNPSRSLHHVLAGEATVEDVLLATAYGPGFIAGGSGIASMADLEAGHMQMLGRALHWLAARHDFVLLDCAAGLAPQSLITVLASEHAVVVTNPEIAALTDAYALIKCLSRQGAPPMIHLVVNRVTEPGLGEATFARLHDVCRRFVGAPIHYLGEVPEDPAVTHRRLGQAPLLRGSPECSTTKAVETIFAALVERVAAQPVPAAGTVEARMAAQIRRW